MLLGLLIQQPIVFALWLFATLTALTVHEFSHALVATVLGDSTAKDQGRLSLNPFTHIDWMGLLLLITVGVGWGKPVPFNPWNLRLPRLGPALVGMAGPGANLLLALLAAGGASFVMNAGMVNPSNLIMVFLTLLMVINVMLMAFNLIPLPPLDGSKVLLAFLTSPRYDALRYHLETRGPLLLLFLIIIDRVTDVSLFGGFMQGVFKLVQGITGISL